jgi:amidase
LTALDPDIICGLDAHAQAGLVKRGEVPRTALVEAAIARILRLDPGVNAVSHFAFEHALQTARDQQSSGPMAGVPYLLKASMEYPGFPHVAGSRTRKERIGKRKFPFAEKLDEAGLIPCGMSTMPEFGLLGTGEALLYGPTHNPWRPTHGSGGSSSGAAVAVATGMVPLATGSDGGGSIRIPASHCGVIGFKPSRGWNLRARAASLTDDLLASDALLARSMRDTVWAAQFLRMQPAERIDVSRPLTIALCLRGLDNQLPEPAIAEVVARTARLCEELGHRVEETELPLDMESLRRAFGILWCYGAGEVVDLCRAELGPRADLQLEPWTLGLAYRREDLSPNEVASAFVAISQIDRQLSSFWTRYDLVLGPVTSSSAPPLGLLAPDRPFEDLWEDHFRHVNHTQLQNMAGFPGLSLPLFSCTDGMPAGAMFWARHGNDDLLLAMGRILEHAQPWAGPKN